MGVRRIDLLCSMSNEPLGSLGPCRPGRSNRKWRFLLGLKQPWKIEVEWDLVGFGPWKMEVYGCFYGMNGIETRNMSLKSHEKSKKNGLNNKWFNGISWDWTKKTIGIKPFSCKGNVMRIYDGNLTLVAFSALGHITIDLTRRIWNSGLQCRHFLTRNGFSWDGRFCARPWKVVGFRTSTNH